MRIRHKPQSICFITIGNIYSTIFLFANITNYKIHQPSSVNHNIAISSKINIIFIFINKLKSFLIIKIKTIICNIKTKIRSFPTKTPPRKLVVVFVTLFDKISSFDYRPSSDRLLRSLRQLADLVVLADILYVKYLFRKFYL